MNDTKRVLLALIRRRPGARPQDMVAETGLARTTITENLAELQLRGWVRAGMRAGDARSRCYFLTHACAACDTPILDGTTFRERNGKRWHTECYPKECPGRAGDPDDACSEDAADGPGACWRHRPMGPKGVPE